MTEPALCGAVLIGLGATAFMDLVAWFQRHALGMPVANYCLVGRWVASMPSGRFRHVSIAAAAPQPYECLVGWGVHYAVGVAFATLLLLVVPASWLAQPSLLPAMLVGLLTLVMPFAVMQPCFGLGFAARKTPQPWLARRRSVIAHALFGLGLYLSARALSAWAGP